MERKMYQVMEIGRRIRETYVILATQEEISSRLNALKEMSEDKKYSATAWLVGQDGQGYVDLERTWSLYGTKAV